MRHAGKAILMGLALAGACGGAWAQLPPAVPIEGSVETTTDAVILPADLNGRVTVRSCGGCQHPTLQLDANTQINLAGRKVTLHELASYAQRHPGRALTIHYRLRDYIVSYISIIEQ